MFNNKWVSDERESMYYQLQKIIESGHGMNGSFLDHQLFQA